MENIIDEKNSSCIKGIEDYVTHRFITSNKETGRYRCEYCDTYNKTIAVRLFISRMLRRN
ncbi:hypothetical protein [Clostridium butyricum]|uniref:hypothetical protein n=1 Tax=Clostridium butyricum TaxID=1492 RepID=UPI000A40F7B9|nr:hypothetical protein [Clostridium butyricum]